LTVTAADRRRLFPKKTIRDVELDGARALVRVDFNVPLSGDGPEREVADDARIRASLPTLDFLRDRGCPLVLVSHLGRPEDREPELSMAPVSRRLEELTGVKVLQAPAVVGDEVESMASSLDPGGILMLENSRFEPGETKNDAELARRLAALADVYVNDAFGAAHRAHATTEGVAHHLPALAGFLLEREVTVLSSLLVAPARPVVIVLGGAKVSDKIGVIERFLEVADSILIGGAMCFSFFRAQGLPTGDSLVEEEGVEHARRLLDVAARGGGARLELPRDLELADRFAADAKRRTVSGQEVPEGWMGLDIGPRTAQLYTSEIGAAGTVFWNGPMGAFELEQFAAGTRAVAEAMTSTDAITVVGGGDTIAALQRFGVIERITHVSTGGGAALELLEGRRLPGLEALDDA
jgi:phosphoglycerate kinase